MKTLLVSINAIDEASGGGLYLRSLYSSYRKIDSSCMLICKSLDDDKNHCCNIGIVRLKKSFLADVFSRLFFLSPTFLAFYFIKILKFARDRDVIAFHSSRGGVLAWVTKRLFPKKVVVIHFDNIEANLIRDIPLVRGVKGIVTLVDRILLPFVEVVAVSGRCFRTYITRIDMQGVEQRYDSRLIFPVVLPGSKDCCRVKRKYDFLFTGSFDFYPNIEALEFLISLAASKPDSVFAVAGRRLDALKDIVARAPDNVIFFSDVGAEKLEQLFASSSVFVCPVELGSGMKTKIAEALSKGLPVVATRGASSGYEDAISSGVVKVFSREGFELGMAAVLNECKSGLITPEDCLVVFRKFYIQAVLDDKLANFLLNSKKVEAGL